MIFGQLEIIDPEHQYYPKYKLREFISSYNSKKEQRNEIDLSIEIQTYLKLGNLNITWPNNSSANNSYATDNKNEKNIRLV